MVMGRLRAAVSDVAETIRRAFTSAPTHPVPFALSATSQQALPLLEARLQAFQSWPQASILSPRVAFTPNLPAPPIAFTARVQSEEAFARWNAGAEICETQLYAPEQCAQMAIPPLPARAATFLATLSPFRTSGRKAWEPLAPSKAHSGFQGFSRLSTHRSLETVMGFPVAVEGQEFQSLPKASSMRYTMQLVKTTGENIRNLDILGIYPVPLRGVTSLQHDPSTGRVLLGLSPEASSSPRAPFLLARKKDDLSYVSCFLEEG